MDSLREKEIEKKLAEAVRKSGGLALKFVSPGWSGAPDRIVLLPGGKTGFVEVKAPGKKPRPLQARRKKQLEQIGCKVFVLDDPGQVGGIIDEIRIT